MSKVQVVRVHARTRCGLCRNGTPRNPFYYGERGGKKGDASIRETELCDDCLIVLNAAFTEAELSQLGSLKPLKAHSLVSGWLLSKSISSQMSATEFFTHRADASKKK